MTEAEESATAARLRTPTLPANPVLVAVLAVTALALLARLYALGFRTFHWDEGRVGYWILRYAETGQWQYDPIVHGPFLPQVNRVLFAVFGASDFVARLPVAVVGGLLPLAAWLFRDRLRGTEVVALSALLAINPLLVYYSRFMRNDVLVGAFALFALGFYVRGVDTGRRGYLYAGTAALALAFTSKENALVYVGMWVGAGALLLDYRLYTARARAAVARDEAGRPAWEAADLAAVVRSLVGRVGRRAWRWRRPLALAAVEFVAILVFFYAPRPLFTRALTNPLLWPAVAEAATVDAVGAMFDVWLDGGMQDHSYMPYLEYYVSVLRAGALPVSVLGVLGFVWDRYAGERPRNLVMFAGYWGFASVLVYPLATDIQAGWTGVHAVVPLAIPAAVVLGALFDVGGRAVRSRDAIGATLAAVVVLGVLGQAVVTAAGVAYLHPQDRAAAGEQKVFIQYGQPADDLKPTVRDVGVVGRQNEGADVLFYGDHFYVPDESDALQSPIKPENGNWFHRLPLPWYFEAEGVQPASTVSVTDLQQDPPPVVVTRQGDRDRVATHLPDRYEPTTLAIVQEIPGNEVYAVVFVDQEALRDARS